MDLSVTSLVTPDHGGHQTALGTLPKGFYRRRHQLGALDAVVEEQAHSRMHFQLNQAVKRHLRNSPQPKRRRPHLLFRKMMVLLCIQLPQPIRRRSDNVLRSTHWSQIQALRQRVSKVTMFSLLPARPGR